MSDSDPKTARIVERIIREIGMPDLLNVLGKELPPSDLQSLLLEIYRRRVDARSPADLMHQYRENRFVQPSQIDPLELMRIELLAASLLPEGWEVMELSPMAPLGSNPVIARQHQNNTVSTARNIEVCSDPTTLLALEYARRVQDARRRDTAVELPLKMCSNHRVVRAQHFSEAAAFAHFRLQSLCIGGKAGGTLSFELEALTELLGYYLSLLGRFRELGAGIERAAVLIKAPAEDVQQAILRALDLFTPPPAVLPYDIQVVDQEIGGYYQHLRFTIGAATATGEEHHLIDGGDTDWAAQLLSNRKQRFVASGFGTERFAYCFGPLEWD